MPAQSAEWLGLRLANGRYQVSTKLGEGGMAYVYRARDFHENRDVVIKVPRPTLLTEAEFTVRFLREIRSLVHLAHPHIVEILDVDEHDGVPFAVLPYLGGGSLRDRLNRGPAGEVIPFRPAELSGWFEEVADALDYVHGQGYVHRDVKPDNILFDAEGKVYLSDLGVAKVLAGTGPAQKQIGLTGTGLVMGTAEYMAPELVMGEACDGRVDQYALGVVLYELLAGRRPFEGPNPAAIVVKQTAQKLKPLQDVAPDVPESLSEAVQRSLAKKPRERFPDCASFARAVLAAVDEVQERSAIRSVSCPSCGQRLRLPAEGDVKKFRCPACRMVFEPSTKSFTPPPSSREPAPETGSISARQSKTEPTRARKLSTGMLAPQSRRLFGLERGAPEAPAAVPAQRRAPKKIGWKLQMTGIIAGILLPAMVLASIAMVVWRARQAPLLPAGQAQNQIGKPPSTRSVKLSPGPASRTLQKKSDGNQAPPVGATAAEPKESPPRPTSRRLPDSSEKSPAPGEIWPFHGHSYALIRERLNWHQAKEYCARLGGHLVTIESDEEWDFVRTLRSHEKNTWVGATDEVKEGNWKWLTGKPVNPKYWWPGEPNNVNGGEDHASIVAVPKGKALNDVLNTPLPFICEWDYEVAQEVLRRPAQKNPLASPAPVPPLSEKRRNGLRAELFFGPNFEQLAESKIARQPLINWPGEFIFDTKWTQGPFSVRYTGLIQAPKPGRYKFITSSDDGVRLWVDGRLLIDNWNAHPPVRNESPWVVFTEKSHVLRVDYWETAGVYGPHNVGVLELAWAQQGGFAEQRVPAEALFQQVAETPAKSLAVTAPHIGEMRRLLGHKDVVWKAIFSPDGRMALSASKDNTLRLWDLESGKELRRFSRHSGPVESVAFSPDGRRALSGSVDTTMRLWDVASGKELSVLRGHTATVTSVVFSLDGQQALSGSMDNTIRLWDLASGKEVRPFEGHKRDVTSNVVFAPDGEHIYSGSYDTTAQMWEVKTGKPLQTFKHNDGVRCLACSPDGRFLLCGLQSGSVALWDTKSGKRLHASRFRGHKGEVWGVAFSPDGRWALSAGHDHMIRVWPLAGRAAGLEFGHFDHLDAVMSVAFSADGRLALSASADKTVRLWGLTR